MMDEGYELLAEAVIVEACKDYVKAIKNGEKKNIRALERFFRSGWFGILTSIDPEDLMTRLKEQVRRKK